MPTYEYACKSCGHHLEVVQSFKDSALTECPNCGGPLRKVFGNIGITFKGSGFYKTDSRSDRKTAAAKPDSTKSDSAKPDSTKSDPKPAETAASGTKSADSGSSTGSVASSGSASSGSASSSGTGAKSSAVA